MFGIEIDILVLRSVSIIAFITWLYVCWTTLRWFSTANGTKPLISGILQLGILSTIVSALLVISSLTTTSRPWPVFVVPVLIRLLVIAKALIVHRIGTRIVRLPKHH